VSTKSDETVIDREDVEGDWHSSVGDAPPPRPTFLNLVDKRLEHWITGWNPYDPERLSDKGLEPVRIEESEVRKNGARWFIVAFVLFSVWATTMPINAGVPVMGNVVVAGYRKSVQHPTGGVVEEILTREGAIVKQGEVLLKVNPRTTDANLENVELQYINLLVNESRLKAERSGQGSISWAPELSKFGNDARVIEAKLVQSQLYNARRAEYSSQVEGLNAQISGLRSAVASQRVQLQTLVEELKSSQDLASQGYVPRSQVNQTLRSKSEMEESISTALAEAAKLRSQIAQTRTAYLKGIENDLAELQKTRGGLSKGLQVARFENELSEIRAPVSGTVVGLKVFTVGGVIQAGQVLAEIVPTGGTLVVEAKIPPKLIDKVAVGLESDLRFVAFNQSTTPVIEGRVSLVGVDLLVTQGNPQGDLPEYYLARIETTAEGAKQLGNLRLQPGMPVDVIIKTGERTFMSYLLKPLTDKLALAFKD
jgi:protease secretion system membrane fusion protein